MESGGNIRLRLFTVSALLQRCSHTLRIVKGEDSYNFAFSQKRAEAIQYYFIEKGIEAARLSVSGMGNKPVDTNDTAEGRRRNRKVEIHFVD